MEINEVQDSVSKNKMQTHILLFKYLCTCIVDLKCYISISKLYLFQKLLENI